MEYYDPKELATAILGWRPVSGTADWKGEYYGNPDLRGAPAMSRADQRIDFDWGYGSPGPAIPRDSFSVRWTGTLDLEAGSYTFATTTDDGVRLWVNRRLLIDKWRDQPLRSYSGDAWVGGRASIVMEYYERGELARAHLTWRRAADEG